MCDYADNDCRCIKQPRSLSEKSIVLFLGIAVRKNARGMRLVSTLPLSSPTLETRHRTELDHRPPNFSSFVSAVEAILTIKRTISVWINYV